MSWFSHVSQGADQPTDHRLIPASSFSPVNPPGSSPTPDLSTPSLDDFPPAPHGAASLESQSCRGSARSSDPGPGPISYVTLQEQRCVLSWFQAWTAAHRERFLQDLLGKAVPGKVCTLLQSLTTLQVKDRLPNIFECQLRLWSQWFESWGEDERNHFLHLLEECDPVFVAHFYRSVAGTAGRD
ncbi:uncharacterized protein C14orf119 homolog [Cololabis saira]|uniref:uncharacterized protein C14orf119 homolog n=1 Tax=Cololabis saira TaxID=129043 RepID=UPI002AD2E4B7|nr:uncharacterized protein C14orf119 homolog [Cololabis saira]